MLSEMNDENLNIESVVEKAPINLRTAEGAFQEIGMDYGLIRTQEILERLETQ